MAELPPLPERAGWAPMLDSQDIYTADQMRAYAEQAVAAEREACAQEAENVDEPGWTGYECPNTFNDGKWAAAAAIRARSQEGQG